MKVIVLDCVSGVTDNSGRRNMLLGLRREAISIEMLEYTTH